MKTTTDLPTPSEPSSMPKPPIMPSIPQINLEDVKPQPSLETELMGFRKFLTELKSADQSDVSTSDFNFFIEWNKADYEQRIGPLPSDWDIDRILCFRKSVSADSIYPQPGFHLIVDIAYSNKSKQVFHVVSGADVIKAFQFLNSIGTDWNMLVDVGAMKYYWRKLDQVYHAGTYDDYAKIHHQMLMSLVPGIVTVLEKRQQTKQPLHINIIDAGCGLAPQLLIGVYRLIKTLSERYPDVPVTIKGLGFDFEKVNSDWCAAAAHTLPECASESPDIIFVRGDSFDLEFTMKEGAKLAKDKPRTLAQNEKDLAADAKPHLYCDENSHTIVLSSGTFTRKTLGTGFDCVRALQASWRGSVDQLVLGGETEFLFVRRMLKRIGYRITRVDSMRGTGAFEQPIIILERLSIDEIAKRFIVKINKEKIKPIHLDLSMSPCPEVLLAKIIAGIPDRIEQVQSIDLSFSKITNIQGFVDLLKKLPPLTITYYSNDPVSLSYLLLHLPSTQKLVIRYTKNEFTLAHSKKLLERTGRGHDFMNDPPSYQLLTLIGNILHCSNLSRDRIASSYTEILKKFQYNEKEILLHAIRQAVDVVDVLFSNQNFINKVAEYISNIDDLIIIYLALSSNQGEILYKNLHEKWPILMSTERDHTRLRQLLGEEKYQIVKKSLPEITIDSSSESSTDKIFYGSVEPITHDDSLPSEEEKFLPLSVHVQENKTSAEKKAEHDRVLRQYIPKEDCGNKEEGHLLSPEQEIDVREIFEKDKTLTKLNKSYKLKNSGELKYSVIKMTDNDGKQELYVLYTGKEKARGQSKSFFKSVEKNTQCKLAQSLTTKEFKTIKIVGVQNTATVEEQKGFNELFTTSQLFLMEAGQQVARAERDSNQKGFKKSYQLQNILFGESVGRLIDPARAAEKKVTCITDFNERVKIAILMTQALQDQFHHKNRIHRDVTLDNAIYDAETNTLQFCDLDQVAQVGEQPNSVYIAHNLLGTQRFNDEQVAQGKFSRQTDINALGLAFKKLFAMPTTVSNRERIDALVKAMTAEDVSLRPSTEKILVELREISQSLQARVAR